MIELNLNQIPEDLRKYFRPKRKYGVWILRNLIIWKKSNCMPQSMKDRFSVDFEQVMFFTKNRKYFFEQQFEPVSEAYEERVKYAYPGNKMGADRIMMGQPEGMKEINPLGRNKRAVWEIINDNYLKLRDDLAAEKRDFVLRKLLDAGLI